MQIELSLPKPPETARALNIFDLQLPELAELMRSWGQPAFRARQIWAQLYRILAPSFEAMSDLPAALRERLAAETSFGVLEPIREQTADGGDTRKLLWRLPDGNVLESVLMVYPDRATVCVSTQSGCAMGCVFCATGRMGLLRNVTPGEVLEQVLYFARELKNTEHRTQNIDHITNIVFMGMGEPFANYDRWWAAVERLHDAAGFNLGSRSMTVSTVGLAPGIRRLAGERLPINLAISLHAPSDTLRSELMPVNRRYPLAELMAATDEYIARTNRRVSFEYVLLQGRNDTPELAEELAGLVKGKLCHVNLIPWNPVLGTPLERSHRRRVEAFQNVLLEHGIACTVRVERGVAVAAACGQLAAVPQERSEPRIGHE